MGRANLTHPCSKSPSLQISKSSKNMPYDPALPANNTKASATQMRSQFNGLKALIDAAPGITAAQVDVVNTVAAGQPANVSLGLVAGVLHVSCDIPQGSDGAPGPQGPPGPSVATAIVDGVSTLGPGSNATVAVSFDGSNVHFTFGLPSGANGNDGGIGGQGPQGAPGEVSAQQLTDGLSATLATATANSSANTNAVPTLDAPFANDPPTMADLEVLRGKINEMLLALRR